MIRTIQKIDNKSISAIIKNTLAEFKIPSKNSPASDEEVEAMYEFYSQKGCSYFVSEQNNEICGGIGIAPLPGASPEVCELKKFYLLPEVRGTGIGTALLENALLAAKENGYRRVFIETNSKFTSAIKLFEKMGFKSRKSPLGNNTHSTCGIYFEKLI